MSISTVIGFFNLFFLGLLAGEEFVIRYGVRAPMASLDQKPHIQVRQAMIRTLRILVPAIFAGAILTALAVTATEGVSSRTALRFAEILTLIVFIGITLGGTVPLNQAVLKWEPSAPPGNWRSIIVRWEQLDNARCWAALIAFALSLAATALP